MGGADLIDQKTTAYRLDCRSKCRFCLRIFFDLMDIVYQQLNAKLNFLDSEVIIANSLIGKYSNRQRAFPQSQPTKRTSTSQAGSADAPDHLSEYQVS